MRRALVLLGALAALAVLVADANVFPAPGPILTPVSPGSPPAASYVAENDPDVGLRNAACTYVSGSQSPACSSCTTTANDQTISNCYCANLTIQHDRVTVQCVEVGPSTAQWGIRFEGASTTEDTVIRYSYIHDHQDTTPGQAGKGKCIRGNTQVGALLVENNEIKGCEAGIWYENGDTALFTGETWRVMIRDNWVHSPVFVGDDLHTDLIDLRQIKKAVITGNRADPKTNPLGTAALFLQPPSTVSGNPAPIDDVLVQGNYFAHEDAGSGTIVMADTSVGMACASNVRILDNVFGPDGTPVSTGSDIKECPAINQTGPCSGCNPLHLRQTPGSCSGNLVETTKHDGGTTPTSGGCS